MHKSYLHVTDKQGELRWLPGFLILQETPDCSLPLGRAQNHTPTAGRASESPKMFPAPAAAGPSAPRQLLRERCILQAASAAPSSPATRLACRQHDRNQNCTTEGGGRKKIKNSQPEELQRFCSPCSPEPADPPLSALMHRTTQLRSEAGGITGSWGTCTSNDMISETLQKSQTTAKK